MNLADVDWLGFDLDHTLVKYKNDALGEHIFWACSRYLWENHGYQKEVLEIEVYDPAFNVRGKVWDLSTGDILELNQTGIVTAGWHGKTRLSRAELEERYTTTKPHVHFETIKQFGRGDFFCFNDFFVSPTTQLVACLVHAVDSENEEPSGKEVYSAILSDLFRAFDGNFCPEHFQTGAGYYFQPLRDNISKYVFDRREDQTRAWLEKIREAPFNKKLFLLTNSNFDYSELLLNAAYGDDWRDLFDIIIYRGAKKYGFFDQNHVEKPFLSYTRGSPIDGPPVETTLAEYVCGQQKELISGNLGELTAFLGQDARVVYFGDDVVGDIHYSKTKSSWRAVGIAEELGDENRKVPFTTCSDQSRSLLHTAYLEAGDQVLAECRHFGSA